MSQEREAKIGDITKLLAENPSLSVIRGELGDLNITERNPQDRRQVSRLINCSLTRDPHTEKVGMHIRVNRFKGNLSTLAEIYLFPTDEKNSYYIMHSNESELQTEEIFQTVKTGINIFKAYRECPQDKRNMFLAQDPLDPDRNDSVVEDILRQDADYLDFSSNEDPNPKEVVENIASRKFARRIGLASIDKDPLPSEHILIMEQLSSRKLEDRS